MAYPKPAADPYLIQRVLSASPEQLVAILLEGAQRFLGRASQALRNRDFHGMSSNLSRVAEFIAELELRLNHEAGGALVDLLDRTYSFWTLELMEASRTKDPTRLEVLAAQMGEMRTTWEELHARNVKAVSGHEFVLGDRVV